MENLVNNSTNPIFKPTLTDAEIAQCVRVTYKVVLGVCAKYAATEGKAWRSIGKPGAQSNAQLWVLGACLGHASTQETDHELKKAKDCEVEKLWEKFADVPMNPETERMEADFLHFPTGTSREDIWHWFDERHSKGVAYLLYGEEPEPFCPKDGGYCNDAYSAACNNCTGTREEDAT